MTHTLALLPRFGKSVGGNEVWSHCTMQSMSPPKSGWKIPFSGQVRNTFVALSSKARLAARERRGECVAIARFCVDP